jgi:Transport protein Avl9
MQGECYAFLDDIQLTQPRGPEVELWLGADEGADPAAENDWSLLPFMALSDGAHT